MKNRVASSDLENERKSNRSSNGDDRMILFFFLFFFEIKLVVLKLSIQIKNRSICVLMNHLKKKKEKKYAVKMTTNSPQL